MKAVQQREFRLVPCADMARYAEAALATLTDGTAGQVIPILDSASVASSAGTGPTSIRTAMAHDWVGDPTSRVLSADIRATGGILLAQRGAAETLPAVFYALATARRVVLADDVLDYAQHLAGAESAIIAAPAARFGKRWLKGLLDFVQTAPDAPRTLGLLTGRNAAQLSAIVAKLLIAHERHRVDCFLPDPTVAGSASPEFEVIGAHGNEIHLGYGASSMLCGRRAGIDPAPTSFDCGRKCPIGARIDAATIAATTVFLMSCDGFTAAEGIAPSDFALLFRILDGQAAAVLAPYKHVQANEALLILIEAMARTGYTLGEIARILNARGNRDALPDYGFLVLGDPDLRVGPRQVHSATVTETNHGLVVGVELGSGCHAMTVTLPAPAGAGPLAVLPLSTAARTEGSLCTLGEGPEGQMDVTVFRNQPFVPGRLEVALVPAARIEDPSFIRGRDMLARARLIAQVFGRDAAFDAAEAAVSELLSVAAAFPRPIEQLNMQSLMLNFDRVLDRRLASLRRAGADRAMAALGRRRIWISQEYGVLYPDLRRAGLDWDHACPHCGNDAVVWAHSDRVSSLPRRHVSICNRCGIVADVPLGVPLDFEMVTLGEVRASLIPVDLLLTNTRDSPLAVSLALQLNDWETQDMDGDDCRIDVELAANETLKHRARLRFPSEFQDDILSIQVFLVDEDLGLSFYSQKVRAMVRDDPS